MRFDSPPVTVAERSNSKLESSNILWYACHMGIKVLPANNDWVFKLLFGDERNKSVLIDLLKSLVDLPEEEYDLVFLDTHLKPEFEEDKLGILDVKVRTRSGQIIDIEIQVEPQKHIAKRLSFYKSKMIVEQIGQSEHYDRIQRVICVCITSKTLFPAAGEYLNRFRFYNEANGLRFDAMPEEIYTLELSKVPISSDGTDKWEWVQFLLARTEEEIEMLVANGNPEIRNAANALYRLSANPEVRATYEAREKAWRDRASQIDGAREDEREVWQAVVAGKDAELADRDAKLADRDAKLADAAAENERLRAQVAELRRVAE